MSEAKKTEEAAPKKKSKLPMIIALVAILGGGGFFMKSKGAKKEVPAIELGVIEPMPEEFLVNLGTSQNYLRAGVSLHMAKTFKKEELDHNLDAVKDAIGSLLASKPPSAVRTLSGKRKLKIEIARAVNEILEAASHEEPDPKDKGKEKKDKKKKDAEEEKDSIEHEDWDSQEGPVLKVYFTSFATQ